MKFVTAETVTQRVCEVMNTTPDPRLREITHALVTHLHAFIRQVRPTEAEFEQACAFVVALGKETNETKNEVILASDILGASALITMLNDAERSDSAAGSARTDSALLGPFWRASAPEYAWGECIARGEESKDIDQSLSVHGVVRDSKGQAIADAVVDVWQASPVGLYENQDEQQPDMNLRGRFRSDAEGRFHFKSVRPAGYPVPVDGPCGDLLRAQIRDPYRPAHLHYMVSKPGYQVLVTQVFADDDHRLHTDVTFSVVESLVGSFAKSADASNPGYTLHYDLVLQAGDMHFPTPPIP
jgi:catechol 1,2-dioxygenase